MTKISDAWFAACNRCVEAEAALRGAVFAHHPPEALLRLSKDFVRSWNDRAQARFALSQAESRAIAERKGNVRY